MNRWGSINSTCVTGRPPLTREYLWFLFSLLEFTYNEIAEMTGWPYEEIVTAVARWQLPWSNLRGAAGRPAFTELARRLGHDVIKSEMLREVHERDWSLRPLAFDDFYVQGQIKRSVATRTNAGTFDWSTADGLMELQQAAE